MESSVPNHGRVGQFGTTMIEFVCSSIAFASARGMRLTGGTISAKRNRLQSVANASKAKGWPWCGSGRRIEQN